VVLGAATAYAFGVGEWLRADLGESASSTGTYEGRLESWRALVSGSFAKGAEVVLFGEPFGAGFGRYEASGVWVEYAPHNWYVSIYLRAGLVGLGLLAWFVMAALRRAWSLKHEPWVLGGWVALLVFGWGYSWPWYVMPVLAVGLALPMVHNRPRAEVTRSQLRRTSERRQSASMRR
jgi:hypothetical protein